MKFFAELFYKKATKSQRKLTFKLLFQFFDIKAIITRFTSIAYEKNKYEDEKERR